MKTICILIQTTDLITTDKAWAIANDLAKTCDERMNAMECDSWRTPFPWVANDDVIQALNTPLIKLEDK